MGSILYLTPTTGYSEVERERREQLVKGFAPPDVDVQFGVLEGAPEFLDEASDFGRAIDAAETSLGDLDLSGVDVLLVAGALDPGLPVIRRASPIPVVGPGEAVLAVAAVVGAPTSIVTVDEHAVAVARGFVDLATLKPEIVSIRSIDTPVRNFVTDLEAGTSALVDTCRDAVASDGARAVFLGAMTLGTVGVDHRLRQELGIPIYNPVQIGVGLAVQCCRALRVPPHPVSAS